MHCQEMLGLGVPYPEGTIDLSLIVFPEVLFPLNSFFSFT